jgi:hypothetical protein
MRRNTAVVFWEHAQIPHDCQIGEYDTSRKEICDYEYLLLGYTVHVLKPYKYVAPFPLIEMAILSKLYV